MPDETAQPSVPSEVILGAMQQMYPAEFGHVMATIEAQYWREQATGKPKPAKKAVKKTARTGGKAKR